MIPEPAGGGQAQRRLRFALAGLLLGIGKAVEASRGDPFFQVPAWVIVPLQVVLFVTLGEVLERSKAWRRTPWRSLVAAAATIGVLGLGVLVMGLPDTWVFPRASFGALLLMEVVGVPFLLFEWQERKGVG